MKIKRELCRFDARFCALLRQPLIIDPTKTLEPCQGVIQSKLLDPTILLPTDKNNNLGEYNTWLVLSI